MKKDVSKQNQINRKTVWIVIAATVLVLILSVLAVLFLLSKEEGEIHSDDIYYYPANYEEDIFQNKAYQDFEKGILYCEANVTKLYQVENYESAPLPCQFFLDYFQTVISGKYQEISKFYVDGFFEQEPKFTMQMIYEPYVHLHSVSKETIDDEEVEIYNFTVRYKIFKNNGSFRQNVPSNTAVPQIYQLVLKDGVYQIFRILEIEYEN